MKYLWGLLLTALAFAPLCAEAQRSSCAAWHRYRLTIRLVEDARPLAGARLTILHELGSQESITDQKGEVVLESWLWRADPMVMHLLPHGFSCESIVGENVEVDLRPAPPSLQGQDPPPQAAVLVNGSVRDAVAVLAVRRPEVEPEPQLRFALPDAEIETFERLRPTEAAPEITTEGDVELDCMVHVLIFVDGRMDFGEWFCRKPESSSHLYSQKTSV